jgi:hypothetical protein
LGLVDVAAGEETIGACDTAAEPSVMAQQRLWLLIWCAGNVLVAVVLGGVARLRDTPATTIRMDGDQTRVRHLASRPPAERSSKPRVSPGFGLHRIPGPARRSPGALGWERLADSRS